MTNQKTRLILFLSSYAPLFIILSVRAWGENKALSVLLICLTVASLLVLKWFLSVARTLEADVEKVVGATSLAGDSVSYMVTYILPFLDFDFGNGTDVLAFALFFSVIAVVYVRSNMIFINPILNVAGYHIFRIKTDYGKEIALLTKRPHVPIGDTVRGVRLGDYVLLERTQ